MPKAKKQAEPKAVETAASLDKGWQSIQTERDISRAPTSPSKAYAGFVKIQTPAEFPAKRDHNRKLRIDTD